jgi:transposase
LAVAIGFPPWALSCSTYWLSCSWSFAAGAEHGAAHKTGLSFAAGYFWSEIARALPPLKHRPRTSGRKPNQPRFDVRTALYYVVGIDLTEIEGIDEATALTIISEIGPEVSKFATVKHFCSWLGLCPQIKKTGGQVKSSRTRPGVNRAAVAFRLAANSLYASKGALGAFLRRKKAHLGAPKAVTATAHKLARIVYLALKHGLTYVRRTQEAYESEVRAKQIQSLKKRAKQLGLEVIEKSPPSNTGEAGSTKGEQTAPN